MEEEAEQRVYARESARPEYLILPGTVTTTILCDISLALWKRNWSLYKSVFSMHIRAPRLILCIHTP